MKKEGDMARGTVTLVLILFCLVAMCTMRGLGRIMSPRMYIIRDYGLTMRPTETEIEGLEEGARAWGFVYVLLALGMLAIVWRLLEPPPSGKENAVGVP